MPRLALAGDRENISNNRKNHHRLFIVLETEELRRDPLELNNHQFFNSFKSRAWNIFVCLSNLEWCFRSFFMSSEWCARLNSINSERSRVGVLRDDKVESEILFRCLNAHPTNGLEIKCDWNKWFLFSSPLISSGRAHMVEKWCSSSFLDLRYICGLRPVWAAICDDDGQMNRQHFDDDRWIPSGCFESVFFSSRFSVYRRWLH